MNAEHFQKQLVRARGSDAPKRCSCFVAEVPVILRVGEPCEQGHVGARVAD